MVHRLRRNLSYANVAATLALIIAIAGGTTAIAGNKIGAQDLKKIKVRHASAEPGAFGQTVATVRCRPGEKLVGGGGSGIDGTSAPSGNGWTVVGSVGGRATAYALCLLR